MIEVSAPGSTMLSGEHAVLHGQPAIACAVDKRITVKLIPRLDKSFVIHSQLGTYQSEITDPKIDSRFLFIIQAVKIIKPSTGFELEVTSDFSHKVGLGSSAAVTVATCTALKLFNREKIDADEIFQISLKTIISVQKTGSGCDLAASVYGGIITLKNDDDSRKVRRLDCELPELSLYYCGYKMKTPDVIELVNQKSTEFPELYETLYSLMGKTTEETIKAIETNDWQKTGKLLNYYHGLLETAGVCDLELTKIVHTARKQPEVLGAKISGSGLGDCVITLGKMQKESIENEIEIKVSSKGIIYHVY